MTTKRDIEFYDLSDIVFVEKNGFNNKSNIKKLYEDPKLLTQYILENNIKQGDIIFIGGDSYRPEYCFKIVVNKGEFISSNYAQSMLFESRHQKYLQEIKALNVSYKKVLDKLYNDELYNEAFFSYDLDEFEEYIKPYTNQNLM